MDSQPEPEHEHCINCVNSFCTDNADNCPVEYCRNDCGVTLHRCKWPDHDRHTCPEALVTCINAELGCKEMMSRKALGPHLLRCPASILQCRFTYTRCVAAKLGECALEEPSVLIDEKLLEGDMKLLQDSPKPPCLGLAVENCGYTSMHRGTCPLTEATARGRLCTTAGSDKRVFYCNQIIRRDEFVSHWLSYHLEIQVGPLVERCPLLMYGCTHGQNNLLPSPAGTTLNYDKENDSFLAKSPEHSSIDQSISQPAEPSQYANKIQERKELAAYGYGEEDDESYDVLGQLPVEALLNVFNYLDSVTLWNMSQVNHYFRNVCFSFLVKKRGIVYLKWKKDDVTSGWLCTHKVWSFSKVSENISSWFYNMDAPAMCAHMACCEVYKSVFKTLYHEGEKKQLNGMMMGLN